MQEDIKTFSDMLHCDLLSDSEKDLLRMIYIDKYDYRFIGDKYGLSESTIKKKHNKLLKKISKILQAGL